MDFDWDKQIKDQIDEFNRKLITSRGIMGYAEGGQTTPAGLIPGPVNMNTGDDTLVPLKRGEYVLPVEVLIEIGKRVLDEKVMGLKQAQGDSEPVRNAGIPYALGFAEGGMNIPYEPDWTEESRNNQLQGFLQANPQPQPAGIPQNKVLLQVGAGDTGTGYEPKVTVTDGNVNKFSAMKSAGGVLANNPNNMPDLASTVKTIGLPGAPSVIMRGDLSGDPGMQAIHDRVDWSSGSQNAMNTAAEFKYADEVAQAKRRNTPTPQTEAQILTGIQSGNATWDMPRQQQFGLANAQFNAQEALKRSLVEHQPKPTPEFTKLNKDERLLDSTGRTIVGIQPTPEKPEPLQWRDNVMEGDKVYQVGYDRKGLPITKVPQFVKPDKAADGMDKTLDKWNAHVFKERSNAYRSLLANKPGQLIMGEDGRLMPNFAQLTPEQQRQVMEINDRFNYIGARGEEEYAKDPQFLRKGFNTAFLKLTKTPADAPAKQRRPLSAFGS